MAMAWQNFEKEEYVKSFSKLNLEQDAPCKMLCVGGLIVLKSYLHAYCIILNEKIFS